MLTRVLSATLVAATLLLSGCVNLRSDIHRPPTQDELTKAGTAMFTGPDNGSLKQYYDYTSQLSAWHQTRADGLFTNDALLSELGFVSTAVAVVAGATEHLKAARRAAIFAGGSGIVADRYSIKVQANNYERAADAFLCMRDALGAAKVDEDAQQVLITESHPDIRLGALVKEQVLSILRKLRKAQRDITIATPDAQKIKEALGIASGTSKGTLATPNIDDLAKNLTACASSF